MIGAIGVIGSTEFRALLRRRWFLVIVAASAALIIAGAIVAILQDGFMRADTLRGWVLAVYLLGGLAVATSLGASTVNRDGDGGWVGMQVATGVGRPAVALGRAWGRVLALCAVFGAWIALALIGGFIQGAVDWDLAVAGLAMLENMLVVLLVAALCSVPLGPVASGVFGVLAYIFMQSLVNLSSAVEAGVLGTAWSGVIRTFYLVFPRAIVSPLVSELQARDVAALAAPRLEVNGNVVFVQPSSWGTVIWTLAWCVLLAFATAGALRKRALS